MGYVIVSSLLIFSLAVALTPKEWVGAQRWTSPLAILLQPGNHAIKTCDANVHSRWERRCSYQVG
jgi:hypothetical protein